MSNGDVPIVRSIVAVGAGFFTVMVLSAAADMLLTSSALVVKLAYETAFALIAGYITARISATQRPLFHVLAMAGMVLIGRALIAIAAWDVTPAWFNIGVLVLIVPAALLGAKLSELRGKSLQ